ncbi:MAG: hypothetical protein EOP04_22255 [Proteobacteria bacterium]|nr:MAG: hypothetical protein EOP04_22255 [Pseudomonadota bacterium]
MKFRGNPKGSFPVAVFMLLYSQHVLTKNWNDPYSLPFWFAAIAFVIFLTLTMATFYQKKA